MSKLLSCPAVAALVLAQVSASQAAAPRPAPGPDLATALDLARAAFADCEARGYATASVSVVDSAGVVKLTARDDGAWKAPVAAPLKAFTALTFDQPGSSMQPRAAKDVGFAQHIDGRADLYNDHPGSIPLHRDGALIGAVAVADVPHEVADRCARAAVAKAHLE